MLNNINYQSSNHEQAIKKSILIHGGFKKLTEADFYPEHEKRTATHEYIKVRDKIIIEENAHCVICGTNNEVLSNLDTKQDSKLNPFQARQMELHHFHIEWALANVIDVNKFNNFFKPHLARLHPESQLYKAFMDSETILAWIDHHQDNMMPLCDVHHRHSYYGIHAVSYPDWNASNLYTDDFINSIHEETNMKK